MMNCEMPNWLSNIFEFFESGEITEQTLGTALTFLINEKVILCVEVFQA